jgi:hypothetical protein
MNDQSNQNDAYQQNQDNQQATQYQKRGNGLGVAGMVVGIIAILGAWIPLLNFFSVILGLIALGLSIGGLIVSKKGRPKGTSIAGLVLAAVTILIFILMYGGAAVLSKSGNKTTKSTTESNVAGNIVSSSQSNNSNTTANNVTTTQSSSKKNDYDVKVVSSSLSKDYAGNPLLVVEYEYTNNTDKAKSFVFAVRDKAFQNGVECSNITVSDAIDAQQKLNDVKPGTPYLLKVGYSLQDTKSPVEIEVSNLFGTEPFYKHTIEFK